MHITLLTIFPEYFTSPLATSLIGKAAEKGVLRFDVLNIRDYTPLKRAQVDDTPYGGGAGIIMRPEPLAAAIKKAKETNPGPVIYFTPRGKTLTQRKVEKLAPLPGMILLCGRYEGIDERIIEKYVDMELSLGKFIIQGGEVAALTLIEAVTRFVPDVIGNPESLTHESFSKSLDGKKEFPLYTKPEVFEGMEVPKVLLSGHHKNIAKWQRENLK